MRKLRDYLKDTLATANHNLKSNQTPELRLYWEGVRDTAANAQLHLDDDTEAAMANFYAIVDKANNA